MAQSRKQTILRYSRSFLCIAIFTSVISIGYCAWFTPGNLVAVRTGPLSTNAVPVTLVELSTNGSTIQTIPLPTSGTNALTQAAVFGEGLISATPDNSKLVLVGYNAPAGTPAVYSSPAAIGRRSIATLDYSSAFQIRYTLTSGLTDNMRGGAADNSGNYWASMQERVFCFNTSTTINTINTRAIGIFNGSLYFSSREGFINGVFCFNNNLPTNSSSALPVALGFDNPLDFAISPDNKVIYMADGNSVANQNGGILKFTNNAGVWTNAYYLDPAYVLHPKAGGTSVGALSISVDFSSPNPIIYTTCTDSGNLDFTISSYADNNSLTRLVDTGSNAVGTVIARAGTNYSFRGIRFAPTPVFKIRPSSAAIPTNSGPFQFTGTLFPGQTCRIQSTMDVSPPITWTDISTNTADTNGQINFQESSPSTNRFFRLVSP